MAKTYIATTQTTMAPKAGLNIAAKNPLRRAALIRAVPAAAWMILTITLLSVPHAQAQLAPQSRLPASILDVYSPEARVSGGPGEMRIEDSACALREATGVRRRLVDIAVQEWAFFGFPVVDQTGPPPPRTNRPFRRRPWMDPAESSRVAASIAGYWSITPDGAWILDRQNSFWRGPLGVGERWRDPWSAAFVSWAVCEAGIADSAAFRRSINHRTYIDQAIRARDGVSDGSAYTAYDVGEEAVEPGDLLCSARRHGYRSLDDRRRNLGEGARTHCDIVVHMDPARQRILAIGGNVRGRVSLKLLYAEWQDSDSGHYRAIGRGDRRVFAHLKLGQSVDESAGLLSAPSIRSLAADNSRRTELESLLQIELPATAGAFSQSPGGSDDGSVLVRGLGLVE